MTIIQALKDPKLFKPWFDSSSWNTWVTFLKTLFALPFDDQDIAAYQKHTQRTTAPTGPFREAWVCVGRRGGKSLIAALVAVFLACFKNYSEFLKPGEVGVVQVIAADRRQARVIFRYVRALLTIPMLRKMVRAETQESIELTCDINIEVATCSFRSVRGRTLVAALCDEIAYWRSEESANPDTETIAALRPAGATIPTFLLLCVSSPYARRGALYQAHSRHFGKDSPTLIWQGDSKSMNPSLPDSVIEEAYTEDPISAAAEFGAEFRKDVEVFLSREAIQSCVMPGRSELPYMAGTTYWAFCDPSGGSQDSYTLAISHAQRDGTFVLDLVREKKPPFSPEAITKEFAGVIRGYGLRVVFGDKFGGEFPRELYRNWGVTYQISPKSKSEIYQQFGPLVNSGRIELLDNDRMLRQLQGLERRTSRSGKDAIDHQPGAGSHDDVSNATAGSVWLAWNSTQRQKGAWGGGPYPSGQGRAETRWEILQSRLGLQELIDRQNRR